MEISIILWSVLVLAISSILYLVSYLFYWPMSEKEGSSPFECGIDPISQVKTPFYMHFFFITILFLIFDIELAVSLPLIVMTLVESEWNFFWLLFMEILFLGLVIEIYLETLSWKE